MSTTNDCEDSRCSNNESQDDDFKMGASSSSRDRKQSISSSFSLVNANFQEEETEAVSLVSSEHERQILLLMLLAQVCALHDPTPKTFTVHVLELYERGLLERQAIAFLFDLGLVSEQSPSHLLLEVGKPNVESTDTINNNESPTGLELTISPTAIQRMRQTNSRAQEVSAIRSRLEQEESIHTNTTTQSLDHSNSSWAVDQHPLSLSRYQREFKQGRLISSGSFGSVYFSTNILDGKEYAIKRVTFSASGYRNDSIQQVIREVRCLAQCDHPNVVRYYTSWLEPSWVTGSGQAVTSADQISTKETQKRILTEIHQMVLTKGQADIDGSSGEGSSRFEGWESRSGNSVWSSEGESSRVSQKQQKKKQSWHEPQVTNKQQQRHSYKYQMCFYIQMQLCKSTTLADWIRTRNQCSLTNQYQSATEVFGQIVHGIRHIHDNGIIHRDLKPANIFCGDDGLFKIGDFGLSKHLKATPSSHDFNPMSPLLLPLSQPTKGDSSPLQNSHTAGVGTASYCAPEQVSTQQYGPKADIFSLGLIFLELMCSFGTEHERIITFRDCRRGVLPESLHDKDIASIILACTHTDPSQRPTANFLIARADDSNGKLQRRLEDSERDLQYHKSMLEEKDCIIEELTRKIESLNSTRCSVSRAESAPQQVDQVDVGFVKNVTLTTFDDDDY